MTRAVESADRLHALFRNTFRVRDIAAPIERTAAPMDMPSATIDADASLHELVLLLANHADVRVSYGWDMPDGLANRDDFNRPAARMWMFGLMYVVEVSVSILMDIIYPGNAWEKSLSPGRLIKARQLQEVRLRQGRRVRLADCLQLSDKLSILTSRVEDCMAMGFGTRRNARRVIHDIESLRNHLAHSQDLGDAEWRILVQLVRNLDALVDLRVLRGIMGT